MRTVPSEKYADKAAYRKKMTTRITRLFALALAFFCTYFFFIKLLFL